MSASVAVRNSKGLEVMTNDVTVWLYPVSPNGRQYAQDIGWVSPKAMVGMEQSAASANDRGKRGKAARTAEWGVSGAAQVDRPGGLAPDRHDGGMDCGWRGLPADPGAGCRRDDACLWRAVAGHCVPPVDLAGRCGGPADAGAVVLSGALAGFPAEAGVSASAGYSGARR